MDGLEYLARVQSVEVNGQNSEAELELQEARRVDERLPSCGDMQLAPLDSTQGGETEVTADNYSSGGLQVLSSQPFPEELLVRVATANIECHGVIRHCTRGVSGYLLGIELVEPPIVSD